MRRAWSTSRLLLAVQAQGSVFLKLSFPADDEVVRQRDEGAGSVVDNHVVLSRGDHFYQRVEVPGVDFVAVQNIEPKHVKGLVNIERRIDRTRVDAKR